MAKIVTDYTALEILKHAAKQELYDFHKVYVQTEPATDKVRLPLCCSVREDCACFFCSFSPPPDLIALLL
jgi:hypothetical protein